MNLIWRRPGAKAGIALTLLIVCACGKSSDTPTDPTSGVSSGPFSFRAAPIALDAIRYISPLGTVSPPGRALPTDHIYFTFADPNAGESPVARRTSFFAPADGTVRDVIPHPPSSDVKVVVRATTTIVYYIDHLIPEVAIARGTQLTAGQRLGTTGSSFDSDLGVINDGVMLSFVNPSRYGSELLHTDAPLKFFEEPLRSQLYAKVRGIGPDLDGRIDFDVAGRLSGNWFGESDSTPLAFIYNSYDPSEVRISVAGGLSQVGVFGIAATDPSPRDVSVASGRVRYTITRAQTGPPISSTGPAGRMLVQMLGDQRIQVEIFALSAAADDFTGSSRVFVR